MRKILLGSTAVVGLALTGAAAQAQTAPTVAIHGFQRLIVNNISDNADKAGRNSGQDRQNLDITDELEVWVDVTGKAANGLSYGSHIELQMDNSSWGGAGSTMDIDEAWAFFSTPTLGTVRFGEEDHASNLMAVNTDTAFPGVTAFGPDFITNVSGYTGSTTANSTQAYLWSNGLTDGSDASKLIYMSPQFFGFDFGVSYAPNAGEGKGNTFGTGSTYTTTSPANQRAFTNITSDVTAAIRYRGTFSGVGVSASFATRQANAAKKTTAGANANLQDLSSYAGGAAISYMGFTLAGDYGWGSFSGTGNGTLAQGVKDSTQYSVGLGYTVGALSLGTFYTRSTRDSLTLNTRIQNLWGVGADYVLAPGLELFGQYSEIKDKNRYGNNNSGAMSALVAGVRISW